MEINLTDLKDIATIAKPFVDPIITTIIKPHLKTLSGWLKKRKTENELDKHFFENKFKEYLNRSYRNFININILVLPNQQVNIEEIYIPLTIVSSRNISAKKIDEVDFKFLRTHERLLISDSAGMGKSTLMKWIGLSLIKNGDSIPILIDLKRVKTKNKIIDEIFKQINPNEKTFDRELIYKFLELGSFTILLDGFDEIESEERGTVIADIKDFISKAYQNTFILTSRRESALSSFGEFLLFRIKPLKQMESFQLIRKYDKVSQYGIADKLINEIVHKPSQIKEFLINPFLVSLLYKTYSFNKDIPSKKSTFYDEVYTSLYKHHDLSKDGFERNKKSGLDIHDFRIVLRQLAFNTAKAIKVEYNDSILIKFLKTVNQECIGINFKEVSYVEDLESNVPLFVRDGNHLKWAHKSIQDYFAAEFISSSVEKEKIISKIFKSRKLNYLNILDFLYELEYEIFRTVIILNLLNDFIEYCDQTYNDFPSIKKNLILERQALNFVANFGVIECDRLNDFEEAEKILLGSDEDFRFDEISKTPSDANNFVYRFFRIDYYYEIISILGKKSEPIFRTAKIIPLSKQNSLPVSAKPIFMNDDVSNIGNSLNNFEKLNNMVLNYPSHSQFNKNYLLDYNKCIKLKKVIEKEIASKKDDLLNGI